MWYAESRLVTHPRLPAFQRNVSHRGDPIHQGPERIKGLYAFRSIIDAGARTTLGTDFPVEDMRPLATIYAAVTRLSYNGDSPHGPGGWFPEQRLTRLEALRGRPWILQSFTYLTVVLLQE